MKPALRRSICSTSLAALVALVATAAVAADCPARRADLPAYGLEALFDGMAAVTIGSPNDAPEVNNAAMDEESIASVVLYELWRAERGGPGMPFIRFLPAGTPARVERPEGTLAVGLELWPCLVAPGDQVYLSDGFTDHSTLVHAIDMAEGRVSFVDPRADEVFLLSENSLFDDLGGRWWEEGGRKLFSVPLATMDAVLRAVALSPARMPEASLAAVAAILPALSAADLRYWRDVNELARIDVAGEVPPHLAYVFDPSDDTNALVNSWLYALIEAQAVQRGEIADLAAEFDLAAGYFIAELPKNMNFRLMGELLDAGAFDWAGLYATAYLERRGWDVDIAILGGIGCREAGDAACAEALFADARADLDARLDRMFRGDTIEADRRHLEETVYLNTTIFLMRARYSALER